MDRKAGSRRPARRGLGWFVALAAALLGTGHCEAAIKASAGMPVGDGGRAYIAPETAPNPGGMGREVRIPGLSDDVNLAGSPVEPGVLQNEPILPAADAAGAGRQQTPVGDPEGAPAGFPEPQPYLEAARGLAGDGAELVSAVLRFPLPDQKPSAWLFFFRMPGHGPEGPRVRGVRTPLDPGGRAEIAEVEAGEAARLLGWKTIDIRNLYPLSQMLQMVREAFKGRSYFAELSHDLDPNHSGVWYRFNDDKDQILIAADAGSGRIFYNRRTGDALMGDWRAPPFQNAANRGRRMSVPPWTPAAAKYLSGIHAALETPGLKALRLAAEGAVSGVSAGKGFDGDTSSNPGGETAVEAEPLQDPPQGEAAGTAAGGPSALSEETDQLEDIDAMVEFMGNFHNAAAAAFPQAGFSKADFEAYANHLLLALRDKKPPKPALREGARKIYRERLADGPQRAEFDRMFEEMLAKVHLKTFPDASAGSGAAMVNQQEA